MVSCMNDQALITDRIWSMGEGNVFTGVCYSGCTPPPVDVPPPFRQKTDGQQEVSSHPTGMHTCLISILRFLNREAIVESG